MDAQKLIKLRPYLYHLTDKRNIPHIIDNKLLLSTKIITEKSNIDNRCNFLRTRRPYHSQVKVNGVLYHIRDQRPISIKTLSKCLTHGWKSGDFIEHINKRVFFWCNLKRLQIHFNRYRHESPIIIRVKTKDVFQLNYKSVELCRLNSGATRANSHLGGIAPYRGPETFLPIDKYMNLPSSVVEVTVVEKCFLPSTIKTSTTPDGPWDDI